MTSVEGIKFDVRTVKQLKQQADIVKVIGKYIALREAGAENYSGLCPFHKEKSPSFSVHVVRQFYHCFGCQASGDVFSFVGKIENVSFPEAVRIVAQKCSAITERPIAQPPLFPPNATAQDYEQATKKHAGKLISLVGDHPYAGNLATVVSFDKLGMGAKLFRGPLNGLPTYVRHMDQFTLLIEK